LTFILIIENVDGISDTATTLQRLWLHVCDIKFLLMEMLLLLKNSFQMDFYFKLNATKIVRNVVSRDTLNF
jgi:hypothetical protein